MALSCTVALTKHFWGVCSAPVRAIVVPVLGSRKLRLWKVCVLPAGGSALDLPCHLGRHSVMLTLVPITKSRRPDVLNAGTCCFTVRKPEPEITELPGGFFLEAPRGNLQASLASAGCQQPLAPLAGSRASLSSASVRMRPSACVSFLLRRTPGTGPRTRLT